MPSRPRHRRHFCMVVGAIVLCLGLPIWVGYRAIRLNYAATRSHTPVMSRLGQISVEVRVYAEAHGGSCPTDLSQLAGTPNDFGDHPARCPPDPVGGLDESHWNYVDLGRGLTTATAGPDTVVVYSPPDYGDAGGSHVCFGDGRMDWVTAADWPAVLARGGPATAPATRPATAPAGVQSDHG